MLNSVSRAWIVGGVWSTALIALIAASVAMGARVSTSALLFAMGAAPILLTMLIKASAPSPSVAEILYAVETDADRRR